jgi:hypothetical protein
LLFANFEPREAFKGTRGKLDLDANQKRACVLEFAGRLRGGCIADFRQSDLLCALVPCGAQNAWRSPNSLCGGLRIRFPLYTPLPAQALYDFGLAIIVVHAFVRAHAVTEARLFVELAWLAGEAHLAPPTRGQTARGLGMISVCQFQRHENRPGQRQAARDRFGQIWTSKLEAAPRQFEAVRGSSRQFEAGSRQLRGSSEAGSRGTLPPMLQRVGVL